MDRFNKTFQYLVLENMKFSSKEKEDLRKIVKNIESKTAKKLRLYNIVDPKHEEDIFGPMAVVEVNGQMDELWTMENPTDAKKSLMFLEKQHFAGSSEDLINAINGSNEAILKCRNLYTKAKDFFPEQVNESIGDVLKSITLAGLLGVSSLSADEVKKVDHIIPALSMKESNNKPNAVGDAGKAQGILQIHKEVVDDVNRIYKPKVPFKYPEDALDPAKAKEIAVLYLSYWGKHYERKSGKAATPEVLAKIWNERSKCYVHNGSY